MTTELVAQIAQKYLNDKHPGGANLKIQPSGIFQRETWWYIDVLPDHEPPKRFEYYEALANAETEIEEQENITVFFQPVPVDDEQITAAA